MVERQRHVQLPVAPGLNRAAPGRRGNHSKNQAHQEVPMKLPSIQHILYATDLSENARHALTYAVSMANRYGAKITVMHVIETLSASTMSIISSYLEEEQLERIRTDKEQAAVRMMTERVQGLCNEIEDACPYTEILVERGNPVDRILRQIETGDYDLVVMGTRGLGRFEEAMLGSTARRVIRRSRVPVLVVQLPKGTQQKA